MNIYNHGGDEQPHNDIAWPLPELLVLTVDDEGKHLKDDEDGTAHQKEESVDHV